MARRPPAGRGLRSDWIDFVQWCAARDEAALPASPQTVLDYLVELAADGQGPTAERRLTAIRDAHADVGLASPTDDDRVRIEITRSRWRRRKPAPAVTLATRELRQLLDAVPDGLVGTRDRALLLVGHAGGLRRSELMALDVPDLVVTDEGLSVSSLRGHAVLRWNPAADLCPVRAWQDWVVAAGLVNGPAFRRVERDEQVGINRLSEQAITDILWRASERARLDDSAVRRVADH